MNRDLISLDGFKRKMEFNSRQAWHHFIGSYKDRIDGEFKPVYRSSAGIIESYIKPSDAEKLTMFRESTRRDYVKGARFKPGKALE